MLRSMIHKTRFSLEELEGRKLTASTSASAFVIQGVVSLPVQVAVQSHPIWTTNPNPEYPGEPNGPGTPVIRYVGVGVP